jgi:hypothetical protein
MSSEMAIPGRGILSGVIHRSSPQHLARFLDPEGSDVPGPAKSFGIKGMEQ